MMGLISVSFLRQWHRSVPDAGVEKNLSVLIVCPGLLPQGLLPVFFHWAFPALKPLWLFQAEAA